MPDGRKHLPAIDLQQRQQRAIVDATGVLQAAADGVHQRAVGHGFAECRLLAVLEIGMNFVEVARQAAEVDNVCLRDRPVRCDERCVKLKILEIHPALF